MSLNIDKITTLKALFCFYLGCGFFLSKNGPLNGWISFQMANLKRKDFSVQGKLNASWCWMLATSLVQFSEWCFNYKRKAKQYLLVSCFHLTKEKTPRCTRIQKKKKKRQHGKIYLSLSWNELVLGCGSQHELNVTWVHTDALPQQKK